jgi:hypothetical protein
MRPSDVRKRVAEIGEMKLHRDKIDAEAAHGAEDELYEAVLRAIAKSGSLENARALAEAALETKKIDFPRWTS